MTEAEWQQCTDPRAMLAHLRNIGKGTDRKLRLFAVACCRGVWDWMTDIRSRRGVLTAERFADGFADEEELALARERSEGALTTVSQDGWHILHSAEAAHSCCAHDMECSLLSILYGTRNAVMTSVPYLIMGRRAVEKATAAEELRQITLLRDIFGNPFRSYRAPDQLPSSVVQLAAALYNGQDCAFALIDALEEAGHPQLAGHFREEKDHPKGCWVLDLLLGKE